MRSQSGPFFLHSRVDETGTDSLSQSKPSSGPRISCSFGGKKHVYYHTECVGWGVMKDTPDFRPSVIGHTIRDVSASVPS